jgi:hypothetical protein
MKKANLTQRIISIYLVLALMSTFLLSVFAVETQPPYNDNFGSLSEKGGWQFEHLDNLVSNEGQLPNTIGEFVEGPRKLSIIGQSKPNSGIITYNTTFNTDVEFTGDFTPTKFYDDRGGGNVEPYIILRYYNDQNYVALMPQVTTTSFKDFYVISVVNGQSSSGRYSGVTTPLPLNQKSTFYAKLTTTNVLTFKLNNTAVYNGTISGVHTNKDCKVGVGGVDGSANDVTYENFTINGSRIVLDDNLTGWTKNKASMTATVTKSDYAQLRSYYTATVMTANIQKVLARNNFTLEYKFNSSSSNMIFVTNYDKTKTPKMAAFGYNDTDNWYSFDGSTKTSLISNLLPSIKPNQLTTVKIIKYDKKYTIYVNGVLGFSETCESLNNSTGTIGIGVCDANQTLNMYSVDYNTLTESQINPKTVNYSLDFGNTKGVWSSDEILDSGRNINVTDGNAVISSETNNEPSALITDKVYSSADNIISTLYDVNSPSYANVEYKATFKTGIQDTKSGALFIFRYNSPNSYAAIGVDNRGKWVYSNGLITAVLPPNGTGILNALPVLQVDTDYQITISCIGSHYKIFIGTELKFNAEISELPNVTGKLGLAVFGKAISQINSINYRSFSYETPYEPSYPPDPSLGGTDPGTGGTVGTDSYVLDFKTPETSGNWSWLKDSKDVSSYFNYDSRGVFTNSGDMTPIYDKNSPDLSDFDATYEFKFPDTYMYEDNPLYWSHNADGSFKVDPITGNKVPGKSDITAMRMGFAFREKDGAWAAIVYDSTDFWYFQTNTMSSGALINNTGLPKLDRTKTNKIRIQGWDSNIAIYVNDNLSLFTSLPALNIGSGRVGIVTWCNQPMLVSKVIYKKYDPSENNLNNTILLAPTFDANTGAWISPYINNAYSSGARLVGELMSITPDDRDAIKSLNKSANILDHYKLDMKLDTVDAAGQLVIKDDPVSGVILRLRVPENISDKKVLRIYRKDKSGVIEEVPNLTNPNNDLTSVEFFVPSLGEFYIVETDN